MLNIVFFFFKYLCKCWDDGVRPREECLRGQTLLPVLPSLSAGQRGQEEQVLGVGTQVRDHESVGRSLHADAGVGEGLDRAVSDSG